MIPARVKRVCETFKEVVGEIIQRDLKDPRLGFVTVTEVEMSADLRHARVWVSIMGSREEAEETMRVLERASGFIKGEVGKRVRLRYLPEVVFMRDESSDRCERLESILRSLHAERGDAGASGNGGEDEQRRG
jgi:ribosome-binding factor A